MYQEYGALLGWLLVITISGSLMNYCVIFVAKRYMRNIHKNSTATSVFKFFRIIFVRGHRVFGLIAILLLLTHFLIQFSTYGLNLTGGLAASTLIIQFILGVYYWCKKEDNEKSLVYHSSPHCPSTYICNFLTHHFTYYIRCIC